MEKIYIKEEIESEDIIYDEETCCEKDGNNEVPDYMEKDVKFLDYDGTIKDFESQLNDFKQEDFDINEERKISHFDFKRAEEEIKNEFQSSESKGSQKSVYEISLNENISNHTNISSFNKRNSKPFNLRKKINKKLTTEELACQQIKEERLNSAPKSSVPVKYFYCKECSYKTKRSADLKRHIACHTGEKSFKCAECDYSTSRKDYMKLHIRMHTGDNLFKCSLCDYTATMMSNLTRHFRCHTGERPYQCKDCDYKAARSTDLRRHKRSHTGEKPYLCKVCGYGASQKTHLNDHMRGHTGEKPFVCTYCDFRTAKSSNLKLHIRRHTGEKPYSCTECDYSAARNSEIKRHLKSHLNLSENNYSNTTLNSNNNVDGGGLIGNCIQVILKE